jgi:hypothetical protein
MTEKNIWTEDHVAPCIRKKLALISPTRGGRWVGVVRSRTQATEFSYCFYSISKNGPIRAARLGAISKIGKYFFMANIHTDSGSYPA